MKALILSCNTGGGHNSAGRAIVEAFEKNGDEAVFLDYLRLAGDEVSRTVGNVYVETVKLAPGLFGLVYQIGMLVSLLVRRSPVYYVNGRMAKHLRAYLKEHPVDVILMPHLYPAETLSYMRRKGDQLPLCVAVMTDYTCIPFWEETDCDYYVSPHESLTKGMVLRGVPRERIVPLGIPTSRKCSSVDQTQARNRLGLSARGKYVLVAGGSMGAGTMNRILRLLLRKTRGKVHVIVVCGNNEKVRQRLEVQYGRRRDVTILGFTKEMPLYLRACDVMFTKPGGLTSTEAAAAGIPIVHMKPIPGCETKNRRFFVRSGMSVTAPTCRGQVRKGLSLLADEEAAANMRAAQNRWVNPDSGQAIYEFVASRLGAGAGVDSK